MAQPKVINVMRIMEANAPINLECFHQEYKECTKIYRGRPEMVVMKMTNARNMQLFRGGKIQILGLVSHVSAESMRHECIKRLRKLKPNIQVSPMKIVNLVVKFQLKNPPVLRNIVKSDSSLFYEAELFPAALLSKWRPIHVAMFHNGQVIVTGIKCMSQIHDIMKKLDTYLSSPSLYQ